LLRGHFATNLFGPEAAARLIVPIEIFALPAVQKADGLLSALGIARE